MAASLPRTSSQVAGRWDGTVNLMVAGERNGGEVEAAGSGGHGSADDRGPDVEGSGAAGSVLVGGDVIATGWKKC